MPIKPDFIDGVVLLSYRQIAEKIPDLREHFGVDRWVTSSEIIDQLRMTTSPSSFTMVGRAMRSSGDVVARRTMKGAGYLFRRTTSE